MAARNFGQGQDIFGPGYDMRHFLIRKSLAQNQITIIGELLDMRVGKNGCFQHKFFNRDGDAGCLLPQFS